MEFDNTRNKFISIHSGVMASFNNHIFNSTPETMLNTYQLYYTLAPIYIVIILCMQIPECNKDNTTD